MFAIRPGSVLWTLDFRTQMQLKGGLIHSEIP
jgi:hypothetical protein